MALKKTMTRSIDGYSGEVVAPDVYLKVANVSGDKLNVTIYVTGTSNEVEVYSAYFDFVPSMDGDNFIAQAYRHLKTLPEFVDAVDC